MRHHIFLFRGLPKQKKNQLGLPWRNTDKSPSEKSYELQPCLVVFSENRGDKCDGLDEDLSSDVRLVKIDD